MTRFMLDTNILSHLIRNPQGMVAERITQVGETSICTSVIVAAELRFGAAKKASGRLSERVAAILSLLDVIPLDQPVDDHYAILRAQLEAKGQQIGANDLLIAAHALSFGYTVVTDNEREFRRVEGLQVENWLEV